MPEQEKQHCIFVDFDATMAEYEHWQGHQHLGEPVPEMVQKINDALAKGSKIVVFTARVYPGDSWQEALEATESYVFIASWCKQVFGSVFPITCLKTRWADEIWDDKGRGVVPNTGMFHEEFLEQAI